MANPNYLWVRDVVSVDTDLPAPQGLSFDLLWKARTGQGIQGSNVAAVALATAEQSALPGQRVLYDRPVAPQDISGALVKRVHLTASIAFASIPGTIGTDQTQLDRWTRLGVYEGVLVSNSSTAGYGVDASNVAGRDDTIVTADWMHWRRRYSFEPDTRSFSIASTDPTPVNFPIFSFKVDVKAQRRLKEWDDTVRWLVGPNDKVGDVTQGETINHIAASWSVLLHLPN